MRLDRTFAGSMLASVLLAAGSPAPVEAQSLDFRVVASARGIRDELSLSADGTRVGYVANDGQGHSVATVMRTTGFGRPFFESMGRDGGSTTPALSADGGITRGVNIDFYANPPSGWTLYQHGASGFQYLPGPAPYAPVALSNDGSVTIGNLGDMAFRTTGGFGGPTTALGDFEGGALRTTAHGVSGDGEIVVGLGSSARGDEAFRWQAGSMTPLGDLEGGAFASEAYGISRDGGTIVGFGTSATGREAVRWRDGAIQTLGVLSGDASSVARAASADGSVIVGTSMGPGPSPTLRPFIWDAASGMRDLSVMLTLAGVDLRGVELGTALQISSDGRTIAGTGYTWPEPMDLDSYRVVVWVATVPEPSTALLVGLGLGMLARSGARSRH